MTRSALGGLRSFPLRRISLLAGGHADEGALALASRCAVPLYAWMLARQRVIAAALAVALCLYHVGAIADFGLGRVDGALYPLVDDDVMTSMRYGRNLAAGDGLVYNPGERVEGFTNPLWTLLTGVLHLMPIEPRFIAGILMLTNLGLSLAILWMLLRFWGDAPAARVAGLFAGFFYVALPHHLWYAHAGYEVYLQMAVVLYSLWRIDRLRPADALVLGLLPLSHATGVVMWGILVLAMFAFTPGSWRRAAGLAMLAVAPFAIYETFRIAYYGEILPNTYYLKAGAGSVRAGAGYTARWAIALLPIAIPAMYAVLHRFSARRWLMAIMVVVHAVSIILLNGDILPEFRFLLPCSLLLTALAGAGAADWLGQQRWAAGARLGSSLRTGVVALFALVTVLGTVNAYRRKAATYEMYRRWDLSHIAMGVAIRENTRPDDVVALFGLGHTGYYGERFTIDMLGKADYYVARLEPKPLRFVGHNKSDTEYVVRRSPTYAELDMLPAWFADLAWMRTQQQWDPYGYTFDLALSPAFRERYDLRLVDLKGRRVPFAARKDISSAPWRVPEAFYENQEAWFK